MRLIAAAKSERDSVMLTLLYATGIRVSELCSIRWGHLSEQNGKTFISIFGKGAKTRVVVCPVRAVAAPAGAAERRRG